MPVSDHLRNKLSQVPHKPGIYLHKDRLGTILYVGKARDLRKRVSQYFHPSRRQGWDLKFRALVDAIHDFDWHVVRSEAEALLLEGKLIKEWKPRFNIDFKDDKRFLLLKVHLNDPIPRFTLTRLRREDGAQYFGPFAHSGALRRTLTLIRRKFQLRGCRPLNPNESDHRHCLYGNLKNCTAPCIGNVSLDAYRDQVRAACDFLDGQAGEMRETLEAEMKKAAAALEFEKAAQLRDALADLAQTTERTGRFHRIPYTLPVAINPESDLLELGRILGINPPPARIEGFDVSNISGTFMVSSMVSFLNGRPDRSQYRRFKMKTVAAQNDFACMAETVRRRYTRLQNDAQPIATDTTPLSLSESTTTNVPPTFPTNPRLRTPSSGRFPDLIVIDGGKGQLNAAVEELRKLSLAHLPILGLAKEFEEIHLPDRTEPIRLKLDNNALKLLQRIRDESHRFANTYNAQLRLKKISESLLDEFPGIGEARKQSLLKTFKSIHQLRLASVEQIAALPGFGSRLAGELKAFLQSRQESSEKAPNEPPTNSS